MQDPTEDELFTEQNPIVELPRVEIHPTRLAEIRAERCFDRARVQVDVEAVCTNPERTATQFLSRRVRADRIEIPGGELLADDMSEAESMRRSLHGADDIEAQELRPERRAPNLDPL